MSSSINFPIFRAEFNLLPIETQNEEIGNLTILVGGIRITRSGGETDKKFRTRIFEKGYDDLFDVPGYEKKFFKNRILPSLINDFNNSSKGTQKRLLNKLAELTNKDARMIDSSSKGRAYSSWLNKIPAGSEYKIVKFARKLLEDEVDDDSASSEKINAENSSPIHESDSEGSLDSTNEPRATPKEISRQRNEYDYEGSLVLSDENIADTEPLDKEEWSGASKKDKYKARSRQQENSWRRQESDSEENSISSYEHKGNTKQIKKGERSGASKKENSRRRNECDSEENSVSTYEHRGDKEPVDEDEWNGASKKDKSKARTKPKGKSRGRHESDSEENLVSSNKHRGDTKSKTRASKYSSRD